VRYGGVEVAEATSRSFAGGAARRGEMLMALLHSWILLVVVQDAHRRMFKYQWITMLIAEPNRIKNRPFWPM